MPYSASKIDSMTVRFTWQPEEWREAYQLSTAKPVRRSGPVSMSTLVVCIMALGGLGDVLHAVAGHGHDLLHNRLLLVLAALASVPACLFLFLSVRRWRKTYEGMPGTPEGEQRVIVHETGWRTESGPVPQAGPMCAWDRLRGQRVGTHVLALLTRDGSMVGVPLRAMTIDQGNWIQRMIARKVPREA